ncbi:cytochrome c oxidase subunit 3 [Kordia zhangzhouensis]|uniref:cytochrome c oxidase subunit 3 n=1 Tax=Kordia zhangzhouensis TaxID=1620405 RepID=UPI00062939CE|nr:cytochrome c oxidase subunit 3 [Kordia zhangzhouensis]
MEATVSNTGTEGKVWGGGNKPLGASYGKMMMWFFILSDALTFSGFLAAYGFSRFKFIESWPIADEVYNHFPGSHGDNPMYFVALMTFILIASSVTMVLAVDAGHHMNKKKVTFYMFLTIIGGGIFLGSQAWEWTNFIKGSYGALETKGGQILQFVDTRMAEGDEKMKRVSVEDFATASHKERQQHTRSKGLWFTSESSLPEYSVQDVVTAFNANQHLAVRTQQIIPNIEKLKASDNPADIEKAASIERLYVNADQTGQKGVLTRAESERALKNAIQYVKGANLIHNEYGNRLFADFFFFITGFHGFHVFSGVVINVIIFFNILLGTYERRKNYEMVEKVGLYWHFVDLVWVFVFTFFYLV